MNTLYYGDNLDILRRYVKDETVDLVYLDPPFNSNATYNVLFAEQDGTRAAAQIKAFEDTWRWDQEAAREYEDTVEQGGQVSKALIAFRTLLGESNMMAYLAMMAPRLVELQRVLKPTGSIYLHCDPTASHYLKLLMDAVFGPAFFANELAWVRSLPHGNVSRKFGASHDVLLFYRRSDQATWNGSYIAHRPEYLEQFYKYKEPDGRVYRLISCINPNPNRPNLTYEWKGITKVWKFTRDKMAQMDSAGLLVYSRNGTPQYKGYLDTMKGTPTQDVWSDIPPLMGSAQERLGYPTQKPLALLERIIQASSNPGDTVLDPFCGCGTAVVAAEKLKRQWIGIDITHLAITLVKNRLFDTFGKEAMPQVIGEPVSVPDAEALAAQDPWQFQWWALGLVGARPTEQKKGADKGIDGRLYFHDEAKGKTKEIVISVKAGHTTRAHLHELRGVIDREHAQIGVLITMQEPTGPMRQEAASAGFYESPGWHTKHPRLQILTIGELLGGKGVDYPSRHGNVTFRRAPKFEAEDRQLALGERGDQAGDSAP